MDTAVNTTPEGVPLDFQAFEAYRQAQERGETPEAAKPAEPASPAAAAAKPAAAKTEPDSGTEDQQEDDEEETEGDTEAEAKPQKKSGFQRRIDKLNQKLGAKDAEIEALKRTQGGQAPPPAAKASEAQTVPGAPPKPLQADFENYDDWVEAVADWKLDVREAKKTHDAAVEKAVSEWKTREAAAKAAHDDYDEALAAAATLPVSQAMHIAILESDVGPELTYFFATNPAEAARIHALSDLAAAREIGKIEAKLSSAPAAEPSTPAEPKKPRVSQTPPPPARVRPGSEASGEPDPKDFAKWEAWRNRQPGASLRR